MDQIQVEVVQPKAVHAGVERRQRAVVALVSVPQFGDHVQLVARHAGIGYRAAGLAFVAIDRGGVDMPVTGSQRSTDRLLGFRRRNLKTPSPTLGIKLPSFSVTEREQP